MLKKILVGFVVLIALFCAYASMQPAEFTLSRSTVINAAPEQVFAQVNNFHNWEAWSPWAKMDPSMQTKYEGPESGEGAAYSWEGNGSVGAGKMTIDKSTPSSLIHIKLEFLKPMAAINPTEFTFTPEGQGTKVTWTMSGTNNFIAKAMHVFFDMEKMVGPSFEQGLSSLKGIVEAGKA